MTPSRQEWQRVGRSKHCPICDHPDWCLIARDESAAICARIESSKRVGEAGWLHKLRDSDWRRPVMRTVRVAAPLITRPDLPAMMARYVAAAEPAALKALADALGLTVESLKRLGIGWAGDFGAWAFPMRDAGGAIVGIRLRFPAGRKLAVKGSHNGLFIPDGLTGDLLCIAEGESDCGALLDLGFAAVGRPGCGNGAGLLVDLVKRRKPRQAIIVADADAPGQRGAEALASVLVLYVPDVRMIMPPAPHKDIRAWKMAGATLEQVRNLIDAAKARKVTVCAHRIGR